MSGFYTFKCRFDVPCSYGSPGRDDAQWLVAVQTNHPHDTNTYHHHMNRSCRVLYCFIIKQLGDLLF